MAARFGASKLAPEARLVTKLEVATEVVSVVLGAGCWEVEGEVGTALARAATAVAEEAAAEKAAVGGLRADLIW